MEQQGHVAFWKICWYISRGCLLFFTDGVDGPINRNRCDEGGREWKMTPWVKLFNCDRRLLSLKRETQKVKETTDFHDLINNDNPYASNVAELSRGSIFPVIFEPIRDIKFSRSVYKVTSFSGFHPICYFL